jgi:hypothetical protein
VSHGRRNPGLLRYSLCGPGRPAARESSRDPDQRLRCTDGEHSPGPRTQRPAPRQLRAGDTPSRTTPPESEAQPYAPLPRGRPRRASRSMFAKPPTVVCLSKTGDPCAAPATHPRMDEDPACPVARSIMPREITTRWRARAPAPAVSVSARRHVCPCAHRPLMDEWAWVRYGAFQRPTLCITASSVSAQRAEKPSLPSCLDGTEAERQKAYRRMRQGAGGNIPPAVGGRAKRTAESNRQNRRMGDQKMPGAQVHGKAEEGPRPPGLRAAGWRVAS